MRRPATTSPAGSGRYVPRDAVRQEPGQIQPGNKHGNSRVPAVNGIDIHVTEGHLFTLLNPSDCEKTAALRSVAGLAEPDAGSISVGGRVLCTHDQVHTLVVSCLIRVVSDATVELIGRPRDVYTQPAAGFFTELSTGSPSRQSPTRCTRRRTASSARRATSRSGPATA